jgi:hypothetical protein
MTPARKDRVKSRYCTNPVGYTSRALVYVQLYLVRKYSSSRKRVVLKSIWVSIVSTNLPPVAFDSTVILAAS